MSATVRTPPMWELSAAQATTAAPFVIDLFFRVHQPHYTKQGDRHVLTIPPKSAGEFPESWVSEQNRALDDFICDITLARQATRHATTERTRQEAA